MKLENKVNVNSTRKLKNVIVKKLVEHKNPIMPINLKFQKIGDEISMSWMILDRHYLETKLVSKKLFGLLEIVNDEIDRLVLKIEDSLKSISTENSPNRRDRRAQLKSSHKRRFIKPSKRKNKKIKGTATIKRNLKASKPNKALSYFKAKSKLNLNDWMEVVSRNIELGSKRSNITKQNVSPINDTFLEYRENRYRELLTLELGYTNDLAEKAIENWYSVVIKEDSFMIEK